MKQIPLSRGMFALVDDVDYEALSALKWYARTSKSGNTYAVRNAPRGSTRTHIRMHQVILGGHGVDHINGDGLDNRRCNLRFASASQNQANRRQFSNKHGFKGVGYIPYTQNKGKRWTRRRPWVACITVDHRPIRLGYFASVEEAAAAYDAAAIRYFGAYAATNKQLGLR